jgi:hypothetical protein
MYRLENKFFFFKSQVKNPGGQKNKNKIAVELLKYTFEIVRTFRQEN